MEAPDIKKFSLIGLVAVIATGVLFNTIFTQPIPQAVFGNAAYSPVVAWITIWAILGFLLNIVYGVLEAIANGIWNLVLEILERFEII